MTPVLTADKQFLRWKHERLAGTLGQAAATATPQQQTDPYMQNMLAGFQQLVGQFGSSMVNAMGARSDGSGAATVNGKGAVAMKPKGVQYDEFERAALRGFSCRRKDGELQLIWKEFQMSKNLDTARANIKKKMIQWSGAMGVPIDKGVHFDKKVMQDIMGAQPSPGGNLAVLEYAARGVAILTCCYRSRMDADLAKKVDWADEQSEANRNMEEALQLGDSAPRAPPKDYPELKLAVGTFAALLWTLYGDECTLYSNVVAVWETLDGESVENLRENFMPSLCRKIVWAIHHDTVEYFSQTMHPDAFVLANKDDTIRFPQSFLSHILADVRYGIAPERMTFPKEWKYVPRNSNYSGGGMGGGGGYTGDVQSPPNNRRANNRRNGGGGGEKLWPTGYGGGNNGANGNTNGGTIDGIGHLHPRIEVAMSLYHQRFRGRVHLQAILAAAGLHLSDLPKLNTHLDAGGRSRLCMLNLLGRCSHQACQFKHLAGSSLPEGFVTELIAKTKNGVEYVTRNELPAPVQRIQADPRRGGPGRTGTAGRGNQAGRGGQY